MRDDTLETILSFVINSGEHGLIVSTLKSASFYKTDRQCRLLTQTYPLKQNEKTDH